MFHRLKDSISLKCAPSHRDIQSNAVPREIPMTFLTELEKDTIKICMESQKNPNNQNNLELKD